MDTAGIVIMMILIGAVLGGGTNVLAIRMIFRPVNGIYIGSFRIPFTPGLVPKRREEIAERLGRMVEEYLLTPEGVQSKLTGTAFSDELEKRMQRGIDELLKDERTIDQWLEETFEKKGNTAVIRQNLEKGINDKIGELLKQYKYVPVKETLPDGWIGKAEEKMPSVTTQILNSFEVYLVSEEGQEQIQRMVTRFFESRGGMGSMLGKVVNRFSLKNLLTRELVKFIRDEQTNRMVTDLLVREMHQAMEKRPVDYMDEARADEHIRELIGKIVNEIPVVGEWDKPINQWGSGYHAFLDQTVIPAVMAGSTSIVSKYLSRMMKKIGIRDVVTNQVNQFPILQLEQMIISVAARELKLIALLGALIGGTIGLLQALLFLTLSP